MTSPDSLARPPIGVPAKLLAAGLALLVAALLCEGMARLVYEAPPDPTREPAIMYQSLAGVGFVPAVNQRGWIDDGFVTTNSMGLRGAEPVIPKPNGTTRVLTIGDSTTFGWGVGDAETYPSQLQARFNADAGAEQWDVINGGVSGYDLRRASRWLTHLAPVLEPDIVLVGVFWNDLPYERVSVDGMPLTPAPSEGGNLPDEPVTASAGTAADRPASPEQSRPFRIRGQPTRMNRVLRSSRLLYVLRQLWASMIAPTGAASNQLQWERALLEGRTTPAIDGAWKDLEGPLREMKALATGRRFEIGIMIIPIRAQVETTFAQARYQTRLRSIAEALGMFVVDPLPAFVAESDRKGLFIPYDRMHFSSRGNAALAAVAYDALRTRH